MFNNPTIVKRMQNVGRISPQRTSKHPYVKKLKYLEMTISARAHNLPAASQFKPNEYTRCQAEQTVYKDGSETVTVHILKRRVLVKLSQVNVTMVQNCMKGLKIKMLHVPDGDHEVFIRGRVVKKKNFGKVCGLMWWENLF